MLQTAARNDQCLQLRVRNRELRYRLTQLDEYDITERTPKVSRTLAHFLRGDQTPFPFHQVRRAERFALAVILANALLHLYEGPWCVQYWKATQICFYKGSHPAVPDFRRPYLLTRCEFMEPVASNPHIFEHPYPSLYSFGCLLLEMELRRSINPDNLQDVREAMDEALNQKAELGKNFEQYFEAINACLDIYRFKRGATFQDRQFMDEVYAAIVYPLETVLYESFPDLLGKLSTPARPLDVLTPQTFHSIQSTAQVVPTERTRATGQATTISKIPAILPTSSTSLPVLINDDHHPTYPSISSLVDTYEDESLGVFLHDHVDDLNNLTSEYAKYCVLFPRSELTLFSAREADEWLETLKKEVHPLIIRETEGPCIERIRIAILDTGLQLPEECGFIYSDRVRECRSWVGPLGNGDGDGDLENGNVDINGHGTHSTGLLLEVAPNADIFVARVFEDLDAKQGRRRMEATSQRVSQVSAYSSGLHTAIDNRRPLDMLWTNGKSISLPCLLVSKGLSTLSIRPLSTLATKGYLY